MRKARTSAACLLTAGLWAAAAWFAIHPDWVDVRFFALTAALAVCATVGLTVRAILADLYRRCERSAAAIGALAEGLQVTLEAAAVPPPEQITAETPTGPMPALHVVDEAGERG